MKGTSSGPLPHLYTQREKLLSDFITLARVWKWPFLWPSHHRQQVPQDSCLSSLLTPTEKPPTEPDLPHPHMLSQLTLSCTPEVDFLCLPEGTSHTLGPTFSTAPQLYLQTCSKPSACLHPDHFLLACAWPHGLGRPANFSPVHWTEIIYSPVRSKPQPQEAAQLSTLPSLGTCSHSWGTF